MPINYIDVIIAFLAGAWVGIITLSLTISTVIHKSNAQELRIYKLERKLLEVIKHGKIT